MLLVFTEHRELPRSGAPSLKGRRFLLQIKDKRRQLQGLSRARSNKKASQQQKGNNSRAAAFQFL